MIHFISLYPFTWRLYPFYYMSDAGSDSLYTYKDSPPLVDIHIYLDILFLFERAKLIRNTQKSIERGCQSGYFSLGLLWPVSLTLKGQCVIFSKSNHRFIGSNGLRIWNFKRFERRIRSQMSKIGCARAVRLRQRAFSPVFALSAIPIYNQVCNIKGQISARV